MNIKKSFLGVACALALAAGFCLPALAETSAPASKPISIENVQSAAELDACIAQTVEFLRTKTSIKPEFLIQLGSGFDSIYKEVQKPVHVPYAQIPGFVSATAPGHVGELIFGYIEGHPVCVMRGRLHYYEGLPLRQVVFPIQVAHALGASTLIATNASGAIANHLRLGDLMLITDHINMLGNNPCIGFNSDKVGQRFFPVTPAYDSNLQLLSKQVAAKLGYRLPEGVYVAMSGPSYETAAENRMLYMLGGDAVGMSTVPEVIEAAHCGMKVLGFSCVTDVLNDDDSEDMEQAVIKAGEDACARMTNLLHGILRELPLSK